MAAVAFSAASVDNPGGIRVKLVTVTPSDSYPTGGEPMAASDAGLRRVLAAAPAVSAAAGYVWTWTGSKWKAYWVDTTVDGAAMAEVANTTNLSAAPFTALVLGVD